MLECRSCPPAPVDQHVSEDDHGGGPDPEDDGAGERSPGEGGGSTDTSARAVTGAPSVDEADGGGGGDLGSGPDVPVHGSSDGPDGGGLLPSEFTGQGDTT